MRTIHHVVDIDASQADVFSALTEEPGIARWWSTRVEAPDASAGSVVNWTFQPGFNPDMLISYVERPSLLVWSCVAGHDPWAENNFRFELDALEDGRTRLRFWQNYAVELSDDEFGIYSFNWAYYLESLRLYCSTGEGKPFDPS
jgi:uncharacterized protein YndB with AHSA1/START domain